MLPLLLTVLLLTTTPAIAQSDAPASFDLLDFYKHLHQHPELSFQEAKTAALLARQLAEFGFSVTEEVGGHGVVAVLANGDGPTVMLRMDTDGLPVKEETGLDYASIEQAVEQDGRNVSVMHACGHDVHMSVVTGAARQLASQRDAWQGTLVVIAQPAEERGAGARLMLEDGLFERFPKPDYNLSVHTIATLPAGKVGYIAGWMMANVDMVDIHLGGVGGHGAYPHTTNDPLVLAAAIVMDLQTLVSREVPPTEPAVVTVGSIHGGTKHNIIPDEAQLQITVRSYTDAVRNTLLTGIERIATHQAMAMGFGQDQLPEVTIRDEYTPALWNDPALVQRSVAAMSSAIGADRLVEIPAEMGGEDFSRYGRTADKIPGFMLRLGTVPQSLYDASQRGETSLPSLHSARYAPDPVPTLDTGVKALTAAAMDLLAKPD